MTHTKREHTVDLQIHRWSGRQREGRTNRSANIHTYNGPGGSLQFHYSPNLRLKCKWNSMVLLHMKPQRDPPPSCYLLHTLHNEIHLKFCCSTLSIPSNHSLYTGNAGVLHRNWARNLSVLPKKLLDIYCLGFRQDFSYYSLEFHCVLNWIPQWSFEISGIQFMKSHWNDMEIRELSQINSHRIDSVVSLFGAPCHFGWNQTCPIYHQRCKSQWREEFMFIGSLKLCTHHCFC